MTHQKRTAAEAREACLWRQGHSCGRCGRGFSEGEGQLHHRRRRRTLRADELWCTCAVVLLCHTCHAHVHANPEESRAAGMIVSDLADVEQRDVPVLLRYPWVGPSLLGCDGLVRSAP